jgi:GNAT superfamily N-acetyltransferase
MVTVTNVDADEFRYVHATDELARPLLTELEIEYDTRYGDFFGERASTELNRYPAELFDASHGGAFVLLLRQGEPIAGGAFKRLDGETAELKRIWTSSNHRRQGLARRVVRELEAEAVRRGYSRIYLTTGPRQPEAKALYLAEGYRPLFDTALPAEEVGIHPFEKTVGASADGVDR